jgi:hypothetical protein
VVQYLQFMVVGLGMFDPHDVVTMINALQELAGVLGR